MTTENLSEMICDVAVIGGGVSGCVAAIACARAGADTVLIEKRNFLSGDAFYSSVDTILTFHSLKGKLIVKGIPGEIIDRLSSLGASLGHVRDTVGAAWSVTPVSCAALALLLRKMCQDSGVKILSGAELLSLKKGSGSSRVITSGVVKQDGNMINLKPRVWIDASGQPLLALFGGGSLVRDLISRRMPGALIFHVKGVDISLIKIYMKENKAEFHYETLFDLLEQTPVLGCSGFFSMIKAASLPVARDRLLFYQTLAPDEVSVNTSRVPAAFQSKISSAYSEALKQVNAIFLFMKNSVPGFKSSYISYIAPSIGWRENGRGKGVYILSASDVVNGSRFEDEIAYGGFPVDIHDDSGSGIVMNKIAGDGFYGVPYGCVVSEDLDNLFFVGKGLSAEFEAHASVRVQASSMAIAEAAGTAAYLACKRKLAPRELNVGVLKDLLRKNGACIF